MITPDADIDADLIAGIHAPWRASVGECLSKWASLTPFEQSRSYLVLRGEAGARRTLNPLGIAELVCRTERRDERTV